jgi:hypothetical protein
MTTTRAEYGTLTCSAPDSPQYDRGHGHPRLPRSSVMASLILAASTGKIAFGAAVIVLLLVLRFLRIKYGR